MDIARQPDGLHDIDLVVAQLERSLPPGTRSYKDEQFSDWESELDEPPPPYELYDSSSSMLVDDHVSTSASCKFWHTTSGMAPLVLSMCDACNDLVDFILFPGNDDSNFDLDDDDTFSTSSNSSTLSSVASCGSGISLSSLSSASIRSATLPIEQSADLMTPCDLAHREPDHTSQQCKEDGVREWLQDVTHPDQDEMAGPTVDVVAESRPGQSWRQALAGDPPQPYVSKNACLSNRGQGH